MVEPKITVLTTGGTIAASGTDAGATTIYRLDGSRNPLLYLMASLTAEADVKFEQFCHVASHILDFETVLRLARRIDELQSTGAADGIVVTHGTDTLEETAFVLSLVLSLAGPIVLTGAVRPSSALSADGPLNLLNAIRVAASPQAAGRGVLTCLNDRIGAARHITKAHTAVADAFRSHEQGFLGAVTGSEVSFFAKVGASRGPQFNLEAIGELPRVDIIYDYLGMNARIIEMAIQASSSPQPATVRCRLPSSRP